ncbi:MAG: hypothetical protein L0H75_11545, partial [Nitrosospira sp.]|nr:hypothetical protein [Nitrosospira sp.]
MKAENKTEIGHSLSRFGAPSVELWAISSHCFFLDERQKAFDETFCAQQNLPLQSNQGRACRCLPLQTVRSDDKQLQTFAQTGSATNQY